jgi:hypothetical protein
MRSSIAYSFAISFQRVSANDAAKQCSAAMPASA